MASAFWVVTMTDRARAISAFITPFGLFEWNRMPFGLKNAPQIYQRMLDSALYGFTRIPRPGSSGSNKDGSKLDGAGSDEVSTDQSQDESPDLIKLSVLGRRSYIDDILVTAGSWDHLCDRVEDLLDACDRWNLSISQWAALLSPWTLEIVKCKKGEDDILGVIAASVTPRTEVGLALVAIAPKKEPRRQIQTPTPTVLPDERLYVASFDGSARVKRGGGAYSAILAALQRQAGIMVEDEADLLDLVTLNRLDEILEPEIIQEVSVARVVPVTTGSRAGSRLGGSGSSGSRPGRPGSDGSRSSPEVLGDEIVRDLRIARIRQAQDEEAWISGPKTYLAGRIQQLTQDEAKSYSKISMDYDVDLNGLLYYCPSTKHIDSDRDRLMKLVVPETLQQDVLHHYQVSLKGGHQGIGRTYLRIQSHFHWRGLYRSVQRYVGECVDCETGKGRPTIQGVSPGNIQNYLPLSDVCPGSGQRDWDDYAERLAFAINTAQDRIRGETPFYLVYGWDPRSTFEATIPVGSTRRQDWDPRRWRYQIQRHYQQARVQVNERLREAIADRADSHNETARPHQIEAGSRVWLYLDRVKEGYARKLADM
ncbi:unnamed protein product [Phytophthora fragariaefolia]|uniref:Unnamed protein product n=1 Tax=Phytophthora fragariaefolia TaxID=1490495 RepID=A0A9W7CT30_9STRA|nr:unnamed protein product [Phytophthora fragariaefolia]